MAETEDSTPAPHCQDSGITMATVQQWIAEAAPRWPPLPEEHIAAVARASEHERWRWKLRSLMFRDYGSRMSSIRKSIQSARTATATLLHELPAIEAEINRIAEEWEACGGSTWNDSRGGCIGQEHMQIYGRAQQALLPLAEILRATHQAGGQTNGWTEFAGRLADHLKVALDCAGTTASLKKDSPLARVLAHAVAATTGAQPSPTAVARVLNRRESRRKTGEK